MNRAVKVDVPQRRDAGLDSLRSRISLPARDDLPQHLLLLDVPWEMYEELGNVLGDQPSLRMTYDQGALEIMTISTCHEWVKRLTGRMIECLTLELNTNIKSTGSATQKRRLAERALEPDESYYLASEPLVRFKEESDFERDPPPDLALEVDIGKSKLDRMGIYAAMKVPELWRYDHVGDEMLFYVLDEEGKYQRSEQSRAFAMLTTGILNGFLRLRHSQSETEIIRSFVQWARKDIAKQEEPRKLKKRKRSR